MKIKPICLRAANQRMLFLPIMGFLMLAINIKSFGENQLQKGAFEVKTIVDTTLYDTLYAENEFVWTPFETDDLYLYFEKKMKSSTKTVVTLAPNKHDPNVIDTLKTIYWGEFYIETISNDFIDKYLISNVLIKNNSISLKNNIRIGQPIDAVCKTFDVKYDTAKTYQYLELQCPSADGFEIPLYLFFIFEENKLSEILYMNGFD